MKDKKKKLAISKKEESDLIQQICSCKSNGDEDNAKEAFEILYKIYNKPLIGHIMVRILGDILEAENIAQNIWLKAWSDIKKTPEEGGYDPDKGRFYTYIVNRFAKFAIKQWYDEKIKKEESEVSEHVDSKDNDADQIENIPADMIQADESLIEEEDYLLQLNAFIQLFKIIYLCGGDPNQQLAFSISKLICGEPSKGHRAIEGYPKIVHKKYGLSPLNELTDTFWKEFSSLSGLNQEVLDRLWKFLIPMKNRMELKVSVLFSKRPKQLMQLHSVKNQIVGFTFLQNYYTLLFSIESELEINLDDSISLDLMDVFENNGCKLSEKASILVEENGKEWRIVDSRQVYNIIKEDGKLKVYRNIAALISNWCNKVEKRVRAVLNLDYVPDESLKCSSDQPICSHCKLRYFPPCGCDE